MIKYTITASIEHAGGSQTYEVEADSPEDALAKFENGEAEFVSEQVDITQLATPTLRDVRLAP